MQSNQGVLPYMWARKFFESQDIWRLGHTKNGGKQYRDNRASAVRCFARWSGERESFG